MTECRVPGCVRPVYLRGVCRTDYQHQFERLSRTEEIRKWMLPQQNGGRPHAVAWFCTCPTPTLLGNGECTTCRRAPEWATLDAVKAYRAERSDASLGDS